MFGSLHLPAGSLAIVKHIAQAHGGEVSVASVPGRGATFTLSLPPLPAPAEESLPAG